MTPTEIAPGLAVAPQLAPSDIAGLAAQGVKTIINNRPDGEEPGQVPAAEVRAEAERHGIAYVHIPVTMGTMTRADIAAVERAVADSPGPTVAHCRSGTRCYVLWAAGQVLAGKGDAAALFAEGAAKGFDLRALPEVVARLKG